MGAFLSGLLGAAGEDIDKQEKRKYEESKGERDRKRRLVEFAAETAVQKGMYGALPDIFGELDELGVKPEGAAKGVKDPFSQMGGKLAQIFHIRKQKQQQERQQQQADQMYSQVNGAPPPGQAAPQGQVAPAAAPAMPALPPSRMGRMVGSLQSAEAQLRARQLAEQQAKDARKEEMEKRREARTQAGAVDTYTKQKTVDESLDVGRESRQYRQIQDRVAQLRKNPDTKDMPVADLYAIAAGKAPTGGGKDLKGDISPDADSPTGFSRLMIDHQGRIVGRTPGVLPPAGWAPSTATTMRFVPQPDGTFKAVEVTSTRKREIPGMPPTRLQQGAGGAVSRGTGGGARAPDGGGFSSVARPGAIVGQKPPGEGEMAIAHGAQGAMDSAARLSKELPALTAKHPNLTGQLMGRIASVGGHLNMLPGDMRQLLVDKDSIAAFTMGIHRARGRGYADKWAEVIGDPFVNPEATKAVADRIGKIAEMVQKRILSSNRYKPTTMEEIEREMDKEGAFAIFDQPPPGAGAQGSGGGARPKVKILSVQ